MMEEELNFEELKESTKKLAKDTIKETKERKEGIDNLKFIIEKLQESKNPPKFFKDLKKETQKLLEKVNKEIETLEKAEKTSIIVEEELNNLRKNLIERGGEITWSDNDIFKLGFQIGRIHRVNKLTEIAKKETETALAVFGNQANSFQKKRRC